MICPFEKILKPYKVVQCEVTLGIEKQSLGVTLQKSFVFCGWEWGLNSKVKSEDLLSFLNDHEWPWMTSFSHVKLLWTALGQVSTLLAKQIGKSLEKLIMSEVCSQMLLS